MGGVRGCQASQSEMGARTREEQAGPGRIKGGSVAAAATACGVEAADGALPDLSCVSFGGRELGRALELHVAPGEDLALVGGNSGAAAGQEARTKGERTELTKDVHSKPRITRSRRAASPWR